MKQFSLIDTTGIDHGQTLTAAEFRKLAGTGQNANNKKQSTVTKGSGKKPKKQRSGPALPWSFKYTKERARLEASVHTEKNLINRDREYYYQVIVFEYLSSKWPFLKYVAHASPNGGNRQHFDAVRLGLCGMLKGHPDIQILYPKGQYHGLMIEMKKKIKDYRSYDAALTEVSLDQHKVRTGLLEVGFLSVVAYGVDEAIATLEAYFSETELPVKVLERWVNYDWPNLAKTS